MIDRMKRTDYIETREDIISNIETLYSYLHGDSGKESMLWAVDRLKRGKNMVVEVINNVNSTSKCKFTELVRKSSPVVF